MHVPGKNVDDKGFWNNEYSTDLTTYDGDLYPGEGTALSIV